MNPVLIHSHKCFIFTMAFLVLPALSYAQAVTLTATGTLSSPPTSGVDPLGFAGKSVTFVVAIDQSSTPSTHTQGQGFSSSTYAISSPNSVTFNGTGCTSSSPPLTVTLQDLVPGPDYFGIQNCHIGTGATGALWAAIFTIPNGNMVMAAPASVSSSGVTAIAQYTATPGSNCPSPCITTFTLVGSLQATGAAPPAATPSVTSWSPSAPQGSTAQQNQIVTFSFSSPAVCSVSMTPSNPCVESYTISKSISSCTNSSWLLAATNNTAPVAQGTGNTTTGITITVDPTGIAQSSCSGSVSVIYRTGPLGVSTVIPVTLTLVPVSGPPAIFTQPANQTVTVGQSATFTVGATGTAPLTYQWHRNGLDIAGATSASYTTPPATTTDSGASFTVTVTNSLGSVLSNPATLTVATPPTITMQPASQAVNVGQTATFTVGATGSTPLSIQWQRNGVNIGGATSATYTTPPTLATDNGASFAVVVTNSLGFVTSNSAILTVNSPPAITTQPASQTVTAGQTATFTVVASGVPAPSYQWQKNGANIMGATSASYTTPPTTIADNGATFTVTVSNSSGSPVTSSAATLTVTVATAPPAITTQPANQTVTVGQTATFTVVATGVPAPTYQWQKNGVNVGTNAPSYTTPPATTADNGAGFTVTVSNSSGPPVTSSAAILTVNSPPVITTQPANQTVTAGQTATFTVAATGVPAPTYQWQNNKIGNIQGATAASYTTPATAAADDGTIFTVVVTNSLGPVTSNPATLNVNTLPAITTQPANQTVTLGQTATFTVVATGTAPLTYQWQRGGTNIPGATGSSYITPPTLIADNGAAFTVTVTNPAGSVTSAPPAILTVNATPTITTQPSNQSVTAGLTATFTVAATGSAPLSYQWQKNGANIPTATGTSYTTPVTAAADNGTMFAVVVTNSLGSVTSNAATLSVNAPPAITTQPASQTVGAGQNVTFTVVATGSAPLTYQWQRNGTNIAGATGSSFTTGTTALDDGVAFTVVVTNAAGSVTSNPAVLSVNTGPVITTQPTDQSVMVGQTATFTVVASGTPTPAYQWQKSGTAVVGATSSSYTTPATTSADNGTTFTVVLTNSFGSVTSNPATLNVAASPTAITATPSQLIFAYTTNGAAPASQTLTLTSSTTASFTLATSGGAWLTASPSSGSTPATITVSPNTASLAAGTYNGTITVTPAVTTDSPVTIPVQLNVNDPLKMTAAPTQLSFSYVQGGAAPAAQTVNLSGISAFTAAASGAAWVSVTPASGAAPAALSVTVDPTRLNAGSYSAFITITGSASDTPITITVTVTVAAPSTGPAISGIVDAAGFDPDDFAPGSLISIFGARMGPDPGVPFTLNAQGKLDNTLAGVQVLVDGVPAIPLFVWNNQINAILPFTVNTSGQSAIQVVYGGATSPSFYIPLSPAGIRLFTADASGKGPGAILNRDGSPNTAATPADKGSIVSLFVAGAGLLDHPVTAGDVAGKELYSIGLPVSATVNGADAIVFYAGSAPGLVYGVYQVNVQVPANAPSGSQPIMVTVGSSTSHSNVTVFVR